MSDRQGKTSNSTWIYAFTVTFISITAPTMGGDLKYSFSLVKGAGIPVCEALFAVVKAAGSAVVAQCDIPHPLAPDEPPNSYISWDALRQHLPASFSIPIWRKLDLSNPADKETAMFIRALQEGWITQPGALHGNPWGDVMTDDEIRQHMKEFIVAGKLPVGTTNSPNDFSIRATQKFYESQFDYGTSWKEVYLTSSYAENGTSICKQDEPHISWSGAIETESSIESQNGGMVFTGFDDLTLYDEILYRVHVNKTSIRQSGVGISLSKFNVTGEKSGSGEPSACIISVK